MPVIEPRLTYCDAAFLDASPTDEEFILSIGSGGAIVGRFAFNPKHLKRLKLLLDKKIEEFEKRNGGPLVTTLPE